MLSLSSLKVTFSIVNSHICQWTLKLDCNTNYLGYFYKSCSRWNFLHSNLQLNLVCQIGSARLQHSQQYCYKFYTVDLSYFVYELHIPSFNVSITKINTVLKCFLKVNQLCHELHKKVSRSLLSHSIISKLLYIIHVKIQWKFAPVCLFRTPALLHRLHSLM